LYSEVSTERHVTETVDRTEVSVYLEAVIARIMELQAQNEEYKPSLDADRSGDDGSGG